MTYLHDMTYKTYQAYKTYQVDMKTLAQNDIFLSLIQKEVFLYIEEKALCKRLLYIRDFLLYIERNGIYRKRVVSITKYI